ncbi:hypothetical protein [Kocuria sp.]|uniref:hypothetical protein n=1 Tax=Kocuria sp. TaxID=1871328 RepID=UPI0026DBF6A1|nr:hypothetical protein [Kocuria sp.]MDO4918357.1 hypothetical protein [Kocuria sp.]
MPVHVLSHAASTGEFLQIFLQGGSRMLLMIAMALFLAYLLFFLGTVSIASAITTWHQIRRRPRQAAHPRAMAPITPEAELPHQEIPGRGRHTVRAEG